MLDCTIIGVTQECDFERNEMLTYLTIRTSDGSTIKALIDDDAAATVMGLQMQTRGAPTAAAQMPRVTSPAPASPPRHQPAEDAVESVADGDSEDSVRVFGGQEDAPASEDAEPATEEPPPPPPPKAKPAKPNDPRARSRRVPTGRTVPRDDHGYPITPGVDPSDITGSSNRDEDGVGSA